MRSTRTIAAAIAVVLAALGFVAAPAQSGGPVDHPVQVGTLNRYGADAARVAGVADLAAAATGKLDGTAFADSGRDRLYQLYNLETGPHARSLFVVERDLGTLALTRSTFIADRRIVGANGLNGAEWVGTLDTKGHRLLLAYEANGGLVGAAQNLDGQNLPGLLDIDLATLGWSDASFPRLRTGVGNVAFVLAGLQYDEDTDTLLVLQAASHESGAITNNLGLVGWTKAQLEAGGELPAQSPRPVRSCKRDPINDATSLYLTPIMVANAPDLLGDGSVKSFVMFPCYSSTFSANVVIARMPRDGALDPTAKTEQAVVAPAGIVNWAVDTTRGRMYLLNNSSEADAWVYEAASNAFVGIIAMSPRNAYEAAAISLGVDDASGRLYARGGLYGVMITAAAQDPVPQADAYPAVGGGSFPLIVDGRRSRLLSIATDKPNAYQVLAVPEPRATPSKEDPDTRTLQVPEQPGVTTAQYGGNASAYGLRVLLARGVSGAVPSNGNSEVGQVYKDVNSYCGYAERELVLGRVSKTELSDTSRFARASAVDVDNATVVDLKSPSRCDIYNQYQGTFYPPNAVLPFLNTVGLLNTLDGATPEGAQPSGVINTQIGPHTTWDYTAADCSTPGGADTPGPNSAPLTGATSVRCADTASVSASAESKLAKQLTGELAIAVARTSASTKVEVTQDKGLVSTATAKVEGIHIGDISIGFISSTATSYAHGHTKSARTVYDKPRIGFVTGPHIDTCAADCDLDKVLTELNTVLSGRAELRRVKPETRLQAGSPGGYEAGILKSEKQRASDNSLSGDKSNEIPALELVVYNDNSIIGRARQVFQFAGVRVDSHYGIQRASEGSCPTCGDNGILGSASNLIDTPVIGQSPSVSGPDLGTGALVQRGENPIIRFFRQAALGIVNGVRIFFSNPREALLMATAWALIAAPFAAARRRRLLRSLAQPAEEPSTQ